MKNLLFFLLLALGAVQSAKAVEHSAAQPTTSQTQARTAATLEIVNRSAYTLTVKILRASGRGLYTTVCISPTPPPLSTSPPQIVSSPRPKPRRDGKPCTAKEASSPCAATIMVTVKADCNSMSLAETAVPDRIFRAASSKATAKPTRRHFSAGKSPRPLQLIPFQTGKHTSALAGRTSMVRNRATTGQFFRLRTVSSFEPPPHKTTSARVGERTSLASCANKATRARSTLHYILAHRTCPTSEGGEETAS